MPKGVSSLNKNRPCISTLFGIFYNKNVFRILLTVDLSEPTPIIVIQL